MGVWGLGFRGMFLIMAGFISSAVVPGTCAGLRAISCLIAAQQSPRRKPDAGVYVMSLTVWGLGFRV